MKRAFTLFCLCAFVITVAAQQPRKLKVFVSVDMEGVSGVVTGDQTSAGGADYNRFRRLMTEEANAAIKGAFEAGATEVVVNDSHGSMRNLLIEELHPAAKLISNNIKPMGMMQGIYTTRGDTRAQTPVRVQAGEAINTDHVRSAIYPDRTGRRGRTDPHGQTRGRANGQLSGRRLPPGVSTAARALSVSAR